MKNKEKFPNQSSAQGQFIQNCKQLGLTHLSLHYQTIIEKAHQQKIGFQQFIEDIIQSELALKNERSIQYRIKQSKLPSPLKLLADFDFGFQPTLRKSLIMDLAQINFIERSESILLIGDCGTGKSHIAQSLALIACQKGYRVCYTTLAAMLADLNQGVYEKTLNQRLRKYILPDLLLIDEMGHDRLELEVTKEAHLLFKVIDERYNQSRSLIFTTNVQEPDWAEFLQDPISTKAILDRIFHRSVKVEIKGPSYRKYQGEQLQKKYAQS